MKKEYCETPKRLKGDAVMHDGWVVVRTVYVSERILYSTRSVFTFVVCCQTDSENCPLTFGNMDRKVGKTKASHNAELDAVYND